MPGRSPNEAFENDIKPLQDALGCITQYRLLRQERLPFRENVVSSLALHYFRPVPLRGAFNLTLRVGQEFRIRRVTEEAPSGVRYVVTCVSYSYQFAAANGQEILSFHWASESLDPTAIRFPHAHIGPAITAGQTVLRPGDLHWAHIPTGIISLPAIIRLAISEFGVVPLHEDWTARLDAADTVLSAEPHE